MARAKVVEFDYHQFLGILRRASDAGARLDPTDARWAPYIQDHGINEIAATAIARQKYEKIQPVILAEGHGTDGLYFYSTLEEACLKLISID
jgi:hypothetical protein